MPSTVERLDNLGDKIREASREMAMTMAVEFKNQVIDALRGTPSPDDPNRKLRVKEQIPIDKSVDGRLTVIGNDIHVQVSKHRVVVYRATPEKDIFEIPMYERPKSTEDKVVGVKQKCTTNKFQFVLTETTKVSEYWIPEMETEEGWTSESGDEPTGTPAETPTTDNVTTPDIDAHIMANVDFDGIVRKAADMVFNKIKEVLGAT